MPPWLQQGNLKTNYIVTMEEKIDDHKYNTLQEWEEDVKSCFRIALHTIIEVVPPEPG